MREEAAINDGLTLTPGNNKILPDLLVFDTTKYTDWFHRFNGGTSNNTDAYARLSGGTTMTSFLLSGGYTHSVYNFPGNFAEDRATLHSSFRYNPSDHRLTVNFGPDYSYDNNNSPSSTA